MSTMSNGRVYVVCSSSLPLYVATTSTGSLPSVAEPKTLPTSGSATTSTSSVLAEPGCEKGTRTTSYCTSGCTATAVFEISVHGVVVQTRSEAPSSASGPLVTGKRTNTDGSATS